MTHSSYTGLRIGDHVRTSEDSASPLVDCVVLEVSELHGFDAHIATVRFADGTTTELFTDALTLVARPRKRNRAVSLT